MEAWREPKSAKILKKCALNGHRDFIANCSKNMHAQRFKNMDSVQEGSQKSRNHTKPNRVAKTHPKAPSIDTKIVANTFLEAV